MGFSQTPTGRVSQQLPLSLQARHPSEGPQQQNDPIQTSSRSIKRYLGSLTSDWPPDKEQADRCSTAYLRHRLGGGENDRDRDREDEDEDEDEDSLAPSKLELKERLARLRPALQLPAEGLGESRGLL